MFKGNAVDTHSIELPLPEAEALRRVVDRVLAGGDVVVSGGNGVRALLDAAAEALSRQGCRVLRASADAAGGLSLSGLMAQITDRPDIDGHDDEVLELGFQALTVPDAGCEAIALLVEGAEALQRTALRYLQFTCRSAPALRFVLAGEAGMPDLQEDEMAFLRTRLASSPVIALAAELPEAPLAALDAAPVAAQGPDPVPLPPFRPHLVPSAPVPASAVIPDAQPASVPSLEAAHVPLPRPALSGSPERPAGTARRRPPVAWIGIGLAMAASIATGVVIGRYGWPGGSGAASQAAMQPGVPPVAVQVVPEAAPALDAQAPSGVAAAPPDQPGRTATAAPAEPPGSLAATQPADKAASEPTAAQPPAAPLRAGPAAQPDPAPARPRRTEARSREFNPSARSTPPRFTSRMNGAYDRERGLPPSGQEALYLPPVPPSWQPTPPGSSQDRAEERRPIIGTYTTDQNGVRTFRSVP